MNENNILVFDFETGGDIVHRNGALDASVVHPVELLDWARAANALPASSRPTSGLLTSSAKSFESTRALASASRLRPTASILRWSRARSNKADA